MLANPAGLETELQCRHRHLVDGLESLEPTARFADDPWASRLGSGLTTTLADGEVLEKAGVGLSLIRGDTLPASATLRNPEFAGMPFRAGGVSVVVHPRNPYVPTSHLNVRYFAILGDSGEPVDGWIGGGFDLTPCYPFPEDCRLWHQFARDAVADYGSGFHETAKAACDAYFHLPHRKENRGIGGIFFDDHRPEHPDDAPGLLGGVANAYLEAYCAIVRRRAEIPYGERERSFQAYRRGRYVEFNLVYDRGTLFGLQSGGRTESILLSMPPLARWEYRFEPEPGSPEAELAAYLQPRDWLRQRPPGAV